MRRLTGPWDGWGLRSHSRAEPCVCEMGWDGIERAPMLDCQDFRRSGDGSPRWDRRGLAIFGLDDWSRWKNDESGRNPVERSKTEMEITKVNRRGTFVQAERE
jgi:hypothetical protein